MICPSCSGKGWPYCEYCGGMGIVHCCEGDSACNDAVLSPVHPRIAAHQHWMETESRFAYACPDLDQEPRPETAS